jgi:hypothetical protein
MRRFGKEKEAFKRRRKKKRAQLRRKKESALIAAKKNISLKSTDYLKLITRKPTALKKNEDEGLKKSPNRKNLAKP